MNEKIKKLTFFTVILVTTLIVEIIYIENNRGLTEEAIRDKRDFIRVAKSPDLAISTEAFYIRHRTLANISDIYREDSSLYEYFPSTFIYSHSHILNRGFDEKE